MHRNPFEGNTIDAPTTGPASMAGAARNRVVLALPWVLVAVLVAVAVHAMRQTVPATVSDPAGVDGTDTADGTDRVNGTGAADGATTVALPPATEIEVRAAARLALGTHGLRRGDAPDRWVLDQVIGPLAVEGDVGTAAIVVRATVITKVGDEWVGPEVLAAVVPMRTTPEVGVAGPARLLDEGTGR